ncbi:mitochondrial sodium/calcium exchanger protein isoform X2 [Drosophila gunungcola]|uniref:mitochondrial sodium/calcium exchanger protein isoform X2 n=1 Tax=Drosophila gunungcola TaxID=103775 RepID=UPI0022E98F7B|nr:mitochondrial sodium/calcium exchanger protein isoform X2 [Drosophila gunungcola]
MTTKSKFEPNELDAEFDNFWQKVSCYAANQFPFEERCDFVKKSVNCNLSTNETVFITMFMMLCFEILVFLIYTINVYYSPALKTVSRFLHMNEHLAGVTLLAFGNSSADLFSNLASVEVNVPVFANSLSSALFVTMVCGGLVCYISPFQMNAYETIRDILFLILGTFLMDYFMTVKTISSEVTFSIVAFVYVIYILVNVADLYLLRRALDSIGKQIDELLNAEQTPENLLKLRHLERKYEYYSQDTRKVEVYEKNSIVTSTRMRFTTMRMVRTYRVSVNRRFTRLVKHDRTLPKNRGIFKEFLLGLRPIKCKDWRKAELLSRVLLLLRAPIVVLCALYIPLVDYEMEKHGWNKLLNSINMMVNPALSISVLMAFIHSKGNTLWYIVIKDQLIYGAYSLVITVPIAVFVLIQSRTDIPPSYHWAFTVMNLTGSMFIIFICATEIDTLFEVISSLMAIDDDFMGATIKAFTGNLGTLFINAALAAHGYPRMAYASSIGGPLFTIIVTANTVNYVRNLVGSENMHRDQMEEYGNFAFVFLSMGLFSILLWSTTLGFFARRSVGLYSMGLYIIYIIFSMLVQRKVIHSFTPNKQLSAAFGDI